MLEKIIVTLDGSASSEAALGPGRELAGRLGSSLVLLHVVEAKAPRLVHGERHLATAAEAQAYLAGLAERLAADGIPASYHVHEAEGRGGDRAPGGASAVARSVAAHELELGQGLVIMTAHGRHGAATALSGSLPLKVASAGGAAVLLIPPDGPLGRVAQVPAWPPRRIVLPLDGKSEHEASLGLGLGLAKAYGLGLLLVAALPRYPSEGGGAGSSFARLAPAVSNACLEYAASAEEDYLSSVAERAREESLVCETRVLRGRPAKAIVSACEEGDLLALSTHRRLGLDASLDGCVAFEAARRWKGAMLVVPIGRD